MAACAIEVLTQMLRKSPQHPFPPESSSKRANWKSTFRMRQWRPPGRTAHRSTIKRLCHPESQSLPW